MPGKSKEKVSKHMHSMFPVLIITCAILLSLIGCFKFEYGNHLVLQNHLTDPVDSIGVWVCKDQVMFHPWRDSAGVADLASFSANFYPSDNYDGCAVIFTVYSPGRIQYLPADAPFDCAGCDVNHHYLLTDSIAYELPWDYPYWKKDSVFAPPQ